jgi:cytochrome b involved in lipid metabolism
MTSASASTGVFDLVFGLPVHIFINHAVAVLIPLGALAMVLMVVVPRLRTHFAYLSAAVTLLAAVSATVAAESGEVLAERVGYPGIHAEWGEALVPVAWALAALSVVWVALARLTGKGVRVGAIIASVGVVGLSIASVVLVILAGHSGAEVSWGKRVAGTSMTATSVPTPVASSETTPTPTETVPAPTDIVVDAPVLTAELVATRNTPESCWTIVGGNVYDLSAWIAQHPGGSQNIVGMCGRDASNDFERKHGGESSPAAFLSTYLLGSLGDPAP